MNFITISSIYSFFQIGIVGKLNHRSVSAVDGGQNWNITEAESTQIVSIPNEIS
jgi:hypothetical protein